MRRLAAALFVVSFLIALPSHSSAQAPFGGLDVIEWPCICLLPFEPIPPVFAVHLFPLLYIGNPVSTPGALLAPITAALTYPSYALIPPSWVIGAFTPSPGFCGFFYIPPVPPAFPGLCVPFFSPIYGTINPNTGSSPLSI